MTTVHTAPEPTRLTAASSLQQLLVELAVLTLHAKHAHWNVTGPAFLPLHALTDDIAADSRTWTDRVAERAVALGFAVDGRPGTVAAAADPFPAGWIPDTELVGELVTLLDGVAATARRAIEDFEHADPVAHDLTVEILEGLEKYRWMLRAQGM